MLYAKASETLDSYKKEYAAQLMNPTTEVEEPEVESEVPEVEASTEQTTTEPEPEEP
jgi:hypothetical protein